MFGALDLDGNGGGIFVAGNCLCMAPTELLKVGDMFGWIMALLACEQPNKNVNCADQSIAEVENDELHDEIDALSLQVRELQRQNDQLLDTVDKYRADLVQWTTVSAIFKTDKGDISCQLFVSEAPKATANFVLLSEGKVQWADPKTKTLKQTPLYDGTTFHRVRANQFIQGGDPTGRGTFDPGYTFPDEFNDFRFDRGGRLAMANTGPDSNGSQFFITASPLPDLDGKHTIFGQCDNVALVQQISTAKRIDERPVRPVQLKRIVIERTR